MDINRFQIPKIVRGVAWLSISRAFSQVYLFIVTIYIANALSPADYAIMGVAMLAIGLFNLITEFGLGDIVVQRKEISNEDIIALFWFVIIIGTITSFLVVLLSRPTEIFFSKNGISSVMTALAIIPFLRSISIVPYKLIERKLRFEIKAKIDLACRVIAISIGAISAYLGAGIWSLVLIQISEGLLITILAFVFEPIKIKYNFQMKAIKEMMGFGLNIIALRFTWYFRANVDGIIGGKFLDKIDFGYYSFGFKLAQRLADVVANVTSIISIPMLSRYQDDKAKLKTKYLLICKYTAVITFPLFLGGALLSEEIISLLLSEKWLPVINIFRVACIVQIFRIMNSLNENLFISIGKPNYSLKINLLSLVILTGAFLVGIRSGMNGLLMVWGLIYPAVFIGWLIFTFNYNKIEYLSYLKSIKPAVCASFTMIITILLIKHINFDIFNQAIVGKILHLTISLLISGCIYFITVYLIDKKFLTLIFKQK
jgi:O-antigen/teichoic acid export membrane protein